MGSNTPPPVDEEGGQPRHACCLAGVDVRRQAAVWRPELGRPPFKPSCVTASKLKTRLRSCHNSHDAGNGAGVNQERRCHVKS